MNIVAVTSGKGGTGKSCVAAYTALALARSGSKVLLAELGAQSRALDIITAADDKALFDVSDVISGRCDFDRAVAETGLEKNLSLLAGPLLAFPRGARGVNDRFLKSITDRFSGSFDFLFIDGVDFSLISPSSIDTILMVVTPDSFSIRAGSAHVRELIKNGAKNIRLIINNVPAQVLPMRGAEDFDDVIDIVGAQLIGVIPASPKLQYSAGVSIPLPEGSLTIQIFDNIAARLMGQSRPLLVR